MQYMLCCGAMTGEEAPDKIIREREFKLPSGINIDNLDVPTEMATGENSGIYSEVIGQGTEELRSFSMLQSSFSLHLRIVFLLEHIEDCIALQLFYNIHVYTLHHAVELH